MKPGSRSTIDRWLPKPIANTAKKSVRRRSVGVTDHRSSNHSDASVNITWSE